MISSTRQGLMIPPSGPSFRRWFRKLSDFVPSTTRFRGLQFLPAELRMQIYGHLTFFSLLQLSQTTSFLYYDISSLLVTYPIFRKQFSYAISWPGHYGTNLRRYWYYRSLTITEPATRRLNETAAQLDMAALRPGTVGRLKDMEDYKDFVRIYSGPDPKKPPHKQGQHFWPCRKCMRVVQTSTLIPNFRKRRGIQEWDYNCRDCVDTLHIKHNFCDSDSTGRALAEDKYYHERALLLDYYGRSREIPRRSPSNAFEFWNGTRSAPITNMS
ncbi:hypothetical protein BJ508DRAFT_375955 [Ascobolus immersus RN42]|uniref:F-box domain-containing protein n=1 Tax=Ascobolus immersus RN42 TaxID=1160509 RepID=A0A3N4I7K0_ASCIM|nr:hypothetical protein BJ508DRAFT_375955 [Ascobolus immersus RN42]